MKRKRFEPRYAWSFMHSRDYWSQIQTVSKGTAQSGANASILSGLSLSIPALPEQRQIVAKIDSLTGKSKRARAHLDHIPRLVKKYKQAILAATLRGELTREWRETNRLTFLRPERLPELLAEPIRNGLSVRGSDTPPSVRALRLGALRGAKSI